MFDIGRLSGPTPILWFLVEAHLISRHELLSAIFYGGCLSEPPQKKLFFFIILFVIYVNKYFWIFYYNICD
jgi:hypothetical protein